MKKFTVLSTLALTITLAACGGSSEVPSLGSSSSTASASSVSDSPLGIWSLESTTITHSNGQPDEPYFNDSQDPMQQNRIHIEAEQITNSTYCRTNNGQIVPISVSSPIVIEGNELQILERNEGRNRQCRHSISTSQGSFKFRVEGDRLRFLNANGDIMGTYVRIK